MLGAERGRTAIHNWVQEADPQPASDADPNHIALDETVIGSPTSATDGTPQPVPARTKSSETGRFKPV